MASALTALLPVLDDIGRAREHDELSGGFKAVAESLERIVTGLGLESVRCRGRPVRPEDPRSAHASATPTTSRSRSAQAVLQVGYRMGERIVRPARVAVVEPEHAVAVPPSSDDVTPDDAGAPADGGAEDAAAGPSAQSSYDGEGDVDTNDDRD